MTARCSLKPDQRPCPIEDDEQIALVEWVDRWVGQIPELGNFAAIPNGGLRRAQTDGKGNRFSLEAQKLRRMGVRKGYPDILLDVAAGGFHGLRIELKSLRKGAAASPEQRDWLARLSAADYRAVLCRGWVEAAVAIADYLWPLYDAREAEATWRRFRQSIPRW